MQQIENKSAFSSEFKGIKIALLFTFHVLMVSDISTFKYTDIVSYLWPSNQKRNNKCKFTERKYHIKLGG
jgi:hypothetical protein